MFTPISEERCKVISPLYTCSTPNFSGRGKMVG